MTRKRSLSTGLFGMPQALVEAALEQLTPQQREAIKSGQAAAIMRTMVDTAERVGIILEGPPTLRVDTMPTDNQAALDPSTKARGHG